MSNPKGTALITGASRGIGAIYADRLALRGYDLILVARDATRLAALGANLARRTGVKMTVLAADLNDTDDLCKVEARLRSDAGITMLVNNAGIAALTPLLQSDVDAMQRMIELNVTALTRLTYAVAPAFVARGAGTIVNIASIVGVQPEALNGVYGATKAYVLALGHSLQHELGGKGVRIQTVLPGVTATEIWETAGKSWRELPAHIVMSAEDMVDAALAGLDHGELVTLPGLQDDEEWKRYEAARRALAGKLSTSTPAPRYRVAA